MVPRRALLVAVATLATLVTVAPASAPAAPRLSTLAARQAALAARLASGSTITYVVLGDSLGVGLGAKLFYGYAPRLARQLDARGARVELYNLAKVLNRSQDLVTDGSLERAVSLAPDLVTLYIGGNDLLLAFRRQREREATVKAFTDHLEQILATLYRETDALVVVATLYNPYPPGDRLHNQAEKWIRPANAAIRALAARYEAMVADVFSAFDGHQEDYIWVEMGDVHPNDKGYARMAEVFAQALPL